MYHITIKFVLFFDLKMEGEKKVVNWLESPPKIITFVWF